MLTDIQTVTAAYLSDAEANITLVASRPSQAYIRVVESVPMPAGPTIKAGSKIAQGTKAIGAGAVLSAARGAADFAIAQILRLENLDANWDGNDAAKPLPQSLKDARRFIRLLSPGSVVPRPTLHADGHTILFVREPDIYAELEFIEEKNISFYARRGGDRWSGEFTFDGKSLPEGLSQIGLSI